MADMRQLALKRRFDGLVAWHSLFHLPPDDQADMFEVFARYLVPGAPLLFTSGTQRGVTVGRWRGEALYHASLATDEYARLLAEHGFEVIEHMPDDPDCGGATVWLARRT